jgi:hypothetical protein
MRFNVRGRACEGGYILKRIIGLTVILFFFFTLVSCSSVKDTVEDVAKEVSKEVEKEINSLDPRVDFVKNGTLDNYPDITIGDAFEQFFGNPHWEFFEADTGETVIDFTGDCVYQEVDVEANLQFILNDDDTFEVGALSFNDVPQTELITNALLAKAFEQEVISEEVSEEDTSFVSDIGTSFDMATPLETLIENLGSPTEDSYFLGCRYVTFEGGESYFLDDKEFVSGMIISDSATHIFDAYVGTTIDEVSSILGEPADAYYDDAELGAYVATYFKNGYEIWFVADSEIEPTDYAIILQKQ